MPVRRLISRLVLLIAVLVAVVTFGANSAGSSHRTADIWPNGLTVSGDTVDLPSSTYNT
jgi:predicted ATP-dependent Lon-type protease